MGDKPLGLGGKGLSSVEKRVSSRVLGGQRTKPRAVWAGEICDLLGELRVEQEQRVLTGKMREFWEGKAEHSGS